jgi:hypothetical protein
MRYPWTLAAALFAFGVIAWVVVAERPPENPVRIEASRTLAADPESAALTCGQSGDNDQGAQPLTRPFSFDQPATCNQNSRSGKSQPA